MTVILYIILGGAVCQKVKIQPEVASAYAGGEIRCLYRAFKKNKSVQRYMESLSLRTEAPTVYLEDNKTYISVVEAKIDTTIFQHINITVYSI